MGKRGRRGGWGRGVGEEDGEEGQERRRGKRSRW